MGKELRLRADTKLRALIYEIQAYCIFMDHMFGLTRVIPAKLSAYIGRCLLDPCYLIYYHCIIIFIVVQL